MENVTPAPPDAAHGHTAGAERPLAALLAMVRPEAGRLVLAAVCMALAAAATAGYAYLVGPVVRSLFEVGAAGAPDPAGIPSGAARLASRIALAEPLWIGVAIIAAAAIKGLSQLAYAALAGAAGQRILHRLRAQLYAGLLRLSPVDPLAGSPGSLVSRFTVDAEGVEQAVGHGLFAALRDGLQLLALAALAIALDPLLGVVGLLAFPPLAVLVARLGGRIRRRRASAHEAYSRVADLVDETAGGLAVIQGFGAEGMMVDRFRRRSDAIRRWAVRALVLRALSSPVNEILAAGALAGALVYAHGRIAAGTLTPEVFISFFTALLLLYRPVKGLGQANGALQSGLAALARLLPLLTSRPAKSTSGGMALRSEVRLERIEAGYGDGPNVLAGVDLAIRRGERLALVGPSGGGKSTLLALLMGILSPRRGQVRLDGTAADLGPSGASRLCAPVPQEPRLFDDTLRTNVRCGRPGANDTEVERACLAAGVTRFAGRLPEGLDTPLGPGGKALSVGERQRVCLARALLSRAPILLLDELTASLDGETERAVMESAEELLADRAVIVVTHRLSTARWADTVAVLDGGEIRAVGRGETLLAENRRLALLFGDQEPLEEPVV